MEELICREGTVHSVTAGHEDPNVALYMGREVTVTVNDAGASVEF